MMKFSLSNLLLLIALFAVAIGWWCDHRRLSNANSRLNAEAAELFSRWKMFSSTVHYFPNGNVSPNRVYDISKPEDRAEYLKAFRDGQAGGTLFLPKLSED